MMKSEAQNEGSVIMYSTVNHNFKSVALKLFHRASQKQETIKQFMRIYTYTYPYTL